MYNLRELILRFLNADLEEKSRLLHEETGTLLTSEALAHLQAMADQETRDEARHSLRAHIELLKECLAHGVKAAFERVIFQERSIDLVQVVQQLVSAEGWPELQQIIESMPDVVLSEAMQVELAKAIKWADDEDPERLGQDGRRERLEFILKFRSIRCLLEECRREGIDVALRRRLDAVTVQVDHGTFDENGLQLLIELEGLADEDRTLTRRASLYERILALVSEDDHNEVWAEKQYSYGQVLRRLGQYEDDPAHFEKAVKALAVAQQAFERLGRENEAQKALYAFSMAVHECRERGIDLFELGIVAYEDGELPDQVIREIGELLSLTSGENPDTRRDSLNRAKAMCDRVWPALMSPKHKRLRAEVLSRRGTVFMRLGDLDGDPASFEQAVQSLRAAADINTPELSPRAWRKTTTNLAMALMRLGDATGVEAYLDEAIELLRNVNSHSAASPLSWPWAALARQSLAQRRPALLEHAIAAAQKPEVIALLRALQQGDAEAFAHRMVTLCDPLQRAGYTAEEEHTVLLLSVDLQVHGVEAYTYYPAEDQGTVLSHGLAACELAIDVATRLGDVPCMALYQGIKGTGLTAVRDFQGARAALEEALQLYQRVPAPERELYKRHEAVTLTNLGNVLHHFRKHTEAQAAFEQALRLYRALAPAAPDDYAPDMARTLVNLGTVRSDLRQYTQAQAALEEALALYRALAPAEPAVYELHVARTLTALGGVLHDVQEWEAARKVLTEALALCRALTGPQPEVYLPDVAAILDELGGVLRDVQEWEAARAALTDALRIYREFAIVQPQLYTPAVARTLCNLGAVLRDVQEWEAARAHLMEALALCQTFTGSQSQQYKRGVAVSLNTLGAVLRDVQEWEAARQAFEQALVRDRALAELQPEVYTHSVVVTLNNLGDVLRHMQEWEAARNVLTEALALYEQCTTSSSTGDERTKAMILANLGNVLYGLRELDAARAAYAQAIALSEQGQRWLDSAWMHSNLGMLEETVGDTARALAQFEACVAHCERGLGQRRERTHRDLVKRQLEPAYLRLIEHYAQQAARDRQDGPATQERLVGLLESLRQVETLAGFGAAASDGGTAWREAFHDLLHGTGELSTIFRRERCAFVWVHVTLHSVVFMILTPGDCRVRVAERTLFDHLRTLFEKMLKAIDDWEGPRSRPRAPDGDRQLALHQAWAWALGGISSHIPGAAEAVYHALPDDVQALLTDEHYTTIFLALCGNTVNLPWELVRVPGKSPEGGAPAWQYLGLQRLLPRTHSLGELHAILQRQPGRRPTEPGRPASRGRARLALVVGDPRHPGFDELPNACQTAKALGQQLQERGFRLVPDGETLLETHATDAAVEMALVTPFALWVQMGHGDWAPQEPYLYLALAGTSTLTSQSIAWRRWTHHPVVHYDCCLVGTTRTVGGGRFDGLPTAALLAGASCVLASVHKTFDPYAAAFSDRLYTRLLDSHHPCSVGEALLHARQTMAAEYTAGAEASPLVWALTVLWGNPWAWLLEPLAPRTAADGCQSIQRG